MNLDGIELPADNDTDSLNANRLKMHYAKILWIRLKGDSA